MPDDGKVTLEASSSRPFIIWVFGYIVGFIVGFILGTALLLVIGWRADAAEPPVRHVHASSRYDRSPASLHREALRYAGDDVTTWTEVSRPARKRALHTPGVRVWAPPGQLAITYPRTWVTVHRWNPVLTRARFWTVHGNLAPVQRATAVVLRRDEVRLLVIVAHLPAHIQAGDGFQWGNPYRVQVWRKSVDQLARLTALTRQRWHPTRTIVAADWNVDMRRPAWRRYVHTRFDGLRLTWTPPYPRAGTHGRRLIDATLTDGRGRARLLPYTRASDHRPYRERIG